MCSLVAGYVLKDEFEEAVVRAIHTEMQGDTWFSRKVVEKLARQPRKRHQSSSRL